MKDGEWPKLKSLNMSTKLVILIIFLHWQCDTIALNRFIHLMKEEREKITNDIVCNNLPEYEGYVDHLLEGRRRRPAALCW